MDLDSTEKVLRALEDKGVRYVIFGGVALNLHGLARFTEDVDLFIEPSADNVARLKAALASVYADPHVEEISADDLLGDYPAVQYVPPEGGFHLDILTRLGEAFRFVDLEVERIPFLDFRVNVASPRTLYRMKRGTVRPRDWSDAAALKQAFHLDEE
jgi:hypothetical protein